MNIITATGAQALQSFARRNVARFPVGSTRRMQASHEALIAYRSQRVPPCALSESCVHAFPADVTAAEKPTRQRGWWRDAARP